MARRQSRRLNLRVYKLNNLTFVRVNKAISGESPWDIPKELIKATDCSKIEYGKMRRFKKK